jgi:uncharacterized Fe-S cluster-containing radical SAM superfamily protein
MPGQRRCMQSGNGHSDKMNGLTLSKFMYETIALGGMTINQLPISSLCNSECIFCSNTMNPFPIHRLGFRPLDDIKKGISLLDVQAGEIRLGDSLPGRISEGEALLHPDLLVIMQLIRNKVPHCTIQINTNGSLLTKELIERLNPFKPIKFTISYHSDDSKNWQKIFNRGPEFYKVAYESFYHLSMNGFLVEGALVPLPRMVGYSDIQNTLKVLKAWTKKIIIYAPGYSIKISPELKEILDIDFNELSVFIAEMRKKLRIELELHPDLKKPLIFTPSPLMYKTYDAKYKNVLWLLSEAAFERAKKILENWNPYLPNEHFAFMVKNNTYGGNIICSGLLLVSDFQETIKKALCTYKNVKFDLILLPGNAFDRFGDDLTGENYARLKDEFGIPIWLENC